MMQKAYKLLDKRQGFVALGFKSYKMLTYTLFTKRYIKSSLNVV